MKARSLLLALVALASSAAVAPKADAQQASGNIVINVTGFLRLPLSVNGTVTCTATVLLAPATTGNPTIANLSSLLLNTGGLSSGASTNASVSGQNFTCQVIVPYLFTTAIAGQNLSVVYTVQVNDPNSFNFATNPPTPVVGTGVRKTKQFIPNLPLSSPPSQNVNIYL